MRLHEIFVPHTSFEHNFINWFQKSWMEPEYEDAILKFSKVVGYQAPKDRMLYRGVRFGLPQILEILVPLLRDGQVSIPSDRRVTSWSVESYQARRFQRGNIFGFLIKKLIPKEDILLDTTDEELQAQYSDWTYQYGDLLRGHHRLGLKGEEEIVAIKRPLESLKLCEDIMAVSMELKMIRKDLVYPYMNDLLIPGRMEEFRNGYESVDAGYRYSFEFTCNDIRK